MHPAPALDGWAGEDGGGGRWSNQDPGHDVACRLDFCRCGAGVERRVGGGEGHRSATASRILTECACDNQPMHELNQLLFGGLLQVEGVVAVEGGNG